MDKLQMCRICLAENVHMYVVVNKQLQQLYEKLTDVPFMTEDSRPILACLICCAQLKKCYRLMEKCLEAEEQFAQMLKEGYERKPLIDPLDVFHGFIIAPIVSLSIFDELQTDSIVERQEKTIDETEEENIVETEEFPADSEELDDILQPKEEHESDDDLETENITLDNDITIEETPLHHSESDADDNVPIKKVKKTVKKKKITTEKQKVCKTKRKKTDKQKVCKTNQKRTEKQKVCKTKRKKTENQKVCKTKRNAKEPKECWRASRKVGRNIDIEKRAKIVEMFQDGYSNKTLISEILGLSRNTVAAWIKRYKEEGSLKSRQRCGRPKMLSEEQRQLIASHLEINGFTPTRHFAGLFDTSLLTVRRALKASGIHSRRPAKKLFFSEKHKKERLSFAHDFLDFDWNTTIFSDERTFKLNQFGKLILRRRDERGIHEIDPDEIKITIWGWMSAAGPGELVFIPRCTKSSAYVELLDDVMLPTIRNVYPPEELTELIFVRDNSPIYKAGIVREWFHNHPEITVVPWPARSPDLNPIEHVWALMVQRWVCRGETGVEQLKSHCMEVWESLRGTDICSNIVASMRTRLLKCIESDGAYIKC